MDSGGEKEKKKADRLADMKTERERQASIYLPHKKTKGLEAGKRQMDSDRHTKPKN